MLQSIKKLDIWFKGESVEVDLYSFQVDHEAVIHGLLTKLVETWEYMDEEEKEARLRYLVLQQNILLAQVEQALGVELGLRIAHPKVSPVSPEELPKALQQIADEGTHIQLHEGEDGADLVVDLPGYGDVTAMAVAGKLFVKDAQDQFVEHAGEEIELAPGLIMSVKPLKGAETEGE